MKAIVIYFSWDGKVERMAKSILSKIEADEFRIVEVDEYPKEKLALCARVSQELFDGTRPEYVGEVDISGYDTIVFGCPIWAHQLPPVVRTFIERHDFLRPAGSKRAELEREGKTVWPFCSCLTKLDAPKVSEIARACKGCVAKEGFAAADDDTNGLERWVEKINTNDHELTTNYQK